LSTPYDHTNGSVTAILVIALLLLPGWAWATEPATTDTTHKTATSPRAKHRVIAEIKGILRKLDEFEKTYDPAIYDKYYADDVVGLMNGKIMQPPKQSTLKEIERERKARQYDYRIDNLGKPHIGVSNDGSMAWVAISQRRRQIDRRNDATVRSWDYSVLMVFSHTPDKGWQLVTRAHSGEK